MTCRRADSSWRATALAVALIAITLNVLQPLAHAALMREGEPGALWTMFCNSAAANPDARRGDGSMPSPMPAADAHDCCLGLACAPALLEPSVAFLPLPPVQTVHAPPAATDQPSPVGIRDGPHRLRGPPSFLV
jgi:hypothetical protein